MTIRHVDLTCPECGAHHALKLDVERMQRVRVRGKCSSCGSIFDVATRLVAAMQAKKDSAGVAEIQAAERARRDSVWSANPADLPPAADDPSGSFSEPALAAEEMVLLEEAEEVVLLVESSPPSEAPVADDDSAVTVSPGALIQHAHEMPTIVPQTLPINVEKELGLKGGAVRASDAIDAWHAEGPASASGVVAPSEPAASETETGPSETAASGEPTVKRLPVPVISDRPLRPLSPLPPAKDDEGPGLEGHEVPDDFGSLDDLFDSSEDDDPTSLLVSKYVANPVEAVEAVEAAQSGVKSCQLVEYLAHTPNQLCLCLRWKGQHRPRVLIPPANTTVPNFATRP